MVVASPAGRAWPPRSSRPIEARTARAPSGRRALVCMALGIFVGLPAVTALVVSVATLTGWVR